MITRDTLALIQETAQQAQQAQVLHDVRDPRNVHVRIGTEINVIPVPPAVRQHMVLSLLDLIAYARQACGFVPPVQRLITGPVSEESAGGEVTEYPISVEAVDESLTAKPSVWHSPGGVVLVLNDADRLDRVLFMLTISPQFAALQEIAAKSLVFDQAAFIRLLKNKFGVDPILVQPFRKLTWQTAGQSAGEIDHTRNRMGKEVEARVVGAIEIPEEIVLNVPVYTQAGERSPHPIHCAIDLDTQMQRISLAPLPGQLEDTLDRSQFDIHTRLTEGLGGACPIYYGTP